MLWGKFCSSLCQQQHFSLNDWGSTCEQWNSEAILFHENCIFGRNWNTTSIINPQWGTGFHYWFMMRRAGRRREPSRRGWCGGCGDVWGGGKQQGWIPQMRKQLTLLDGAGWLIWSDRRGTGVPQKMRAVFVHSQLHVGSGQGSGFREPLEGVRVPRQPTIERSFSAVTGVKAIWH